jgi:hypothetical protein
MAKSTRTDFLNDDDGDMLINDGDFVSGLSDDKHVSDILSANKGFYRQYPTLGAGILRFLKKQDNNLAEMKREIQVNLQSDGYKINDLTITKEGIMNLDYEPNYNNV